MYTEKEDFKKSKAECCTAYTAQVTHKIQKEERACYYLRQYLHDINRKIQGHKEVQILVSSESALRLLPDHKKSHSINSDIRKMKTQLSSAFCH
jgi:hypothetical protein